MHRIRDDAALATGEIFARLFVGANMSLEKLALIGGRADVLCCLPALVFPFAARGILRPRVRYF